VIFYQCAPQLCISPLKNKHQMLSRTRIKKKKNGILWKKHVSVKNQVTKNVLHGQRTQHGRKKAAVLWSCCMLFPTLLNVLLYHYPLIQWISLMCYFDLNPLY
jgi:hypothetical protein